MTKGKTHHPQAYGDEAYWDNRYTNDAGSFDWYQRYSGLSPLINKYVLKTNRILMVGCGNAVISEDMVNDGYQDIVNVDISAVVIDVMQKKYKDVPQLSYLRLDVREMKMFKDATFDAVIDKVWSKCTIQCCKDVGGGPQVSIITECMKSNLHRDKLATICTAEGALWSLGRKVLRPGGVYMLITYGDPRVRLTHLKGPEINWTRPGSKRAAESSSRVITDPVLLNEDGTLGPQFSLEDPDLHFVYVCTKDIKQEVLKKGGADKKKTGGK